MKSLKMYLLYQANKITRKVYSNIIDSAEKNINCILYIYEFKIY